MDSERIVAATLPCIEGYRVLGELGRGGMGVVYEAEQVSPPRTIAIHVMCEMERRHRLA